MNDPTRSTPPPAALPPAAPPFAATPSGAEFDTELAEGTGVRSYAVPGSRAAGYVAPGTDVEILELVRRGSIDAAFQELMRQHGAVVHRYCVELADTTLADDAHQQVFIQACRARPQFQPRAPLRAWLLFIARRRVLDAVRSRRRQQAWCAVEVADAPVIQQIAPSALELLELKQALELSLARLQASARTAVLLRYQQGCTFDEMATLLGERAGTLQVRVLRALAILRREIERLTGESS